ARTIATARPRRAPAATPATTAEGLPPDRRGQGGAQAGQQILVAVLVVGGELAAEVGQPLEEGAEALLRDLLRAATVALAPEAAGVEPLLELLLHGHRQQRAPQVDRLAHESEARAGDHSPRRAQIVDEGALAEGAVAEVAVDQVLL